VERGLADLMAGDASLEALLVSIGAPRLRAAGVAVPEATLPDPEHSLYARLAAHDPNTAHN